MQARRFRWFRALTAAAVLHAIASAAQAQGPVVPVEECRGDSVNDQDADGLGDRCELALARAFAPHLVVRPGGCNWDVAHARLGGGYFFAVQPHADGIRLAYLPAYFRDCGWHGIKCWLPGVDCSPHAGDSEFLVVELTPAGEALHWRIRAVFLSAHCFGRSGGDCRWYRDAELAAFQWEGGGPVVWVAEGRQANYPSRRACDAGHHALDTCDHHEVRYRFPVDGDAQNIGSEARPRPASGCVPGSAVRGAPDGNASECFWTADRPFRGWHTAVRGVTGYRRYLEELAEMVQRGGG